MNDRYGITIDANINGFKAKMKEAQALSDSLATKLKKDMAVRSQPTDFNLLYNLENQGMAIKNLRTYNEDLSKSYIVVKNSAKETIAEMNKMSAASNTVQQTTNEMNRLENATNSVKITANNTGDRISKAFSRGLRSVRRLTLGFLGARSAFSLFRKYLNQYSAENDLFNQKMMLTTNIITTALAPAFEFFANAIQYATIGLARIIDIMFGTNITAKVLTAGLAKATAGANGLSGGLDNVTDSAKEMKDNLLGIDEITNLEGEDTGSGLLSGLTGGMGDIGNQMAALDDFKKKIAEVDAWLTKSGVKKFFEGLGKVILTVKDALVWTWNKLIESFGTGDFSWIGRGLAKGFEFAAELIGKIDWAGLGRTIGNTISSLILDTDWVGLGKSILKLIISGATAIGKIHFSLIDAGIDSLKNYILKKVGIDGNSIGGKLANAIATGYKKVIKTVTGTLFNPVGTIANVAKEVKGLFKANGGIFTGSSWLPITAYAGGGTPSAGEMFMARESGPEMVGTIGGHTAVMNNDQIVASVSAGVYQAVVSAMGGQSNKPIVLNINGKEFAKATYSDYQEEGSRRGANTSIRRS